MRMLTTWTLDPPLMGLGDDIDFTSRKSIYFKILEIYNTLGLFSSTWGLKKISSYGYHMYANYLNFLV